MNKNELVFWADDVQTQPGEQFNTTTWYRAVGIGNFINKVLEKNEIVGVVFKKSVEESENIFGFILREK